MIKLAMAKGRITEDAADLLKALAFDLEEIKRSRKLIILNEPKTIALVLLKAGDIPRYVFGGAVDIGVVGKDTVLECDLEVYELLELNFSKCQLCLAGPKGGTPLFQNIKIATKYPNMTKRFIKQRGIQAEIIPLSGSIEIAPLIGLSDVIVDLVQTGRTLVENNLEVYEVLMDIAPMLIANKVRYRTKEAVLMDIITIFESYGGTNEIL